jgi:hypothetical protein
MKSAAPAIREKDLREQIRTLAKIYGWRMAFTQYSLRSPKGFPDLVLVRPPRLVFAELKSETGKTTTDQDEWLDKLRVVAGANDGLLHARSIEVYLWRPSDIERIAEILR